ncbi:hypothetical protein NQ314_006389 [Rhamnusium bicolor]|uniref:Uncharacterized protein n=1 Tax=Rhamnusium bicolor TaxID=1586634 RepID=A0AAV8Z3M6_9CUCU|nr:hypothetical protein NQ314_006389 [Rhamnusium bicolor]
MNLDISLIEAATELNNYYISRKYFKKYGSRKNVKLQLAFGNIAFLKSKMMTTSQDEIKAYFQALEIFGKSAIQTSIINHGGNFIKSSICFLLILSSVLLVFSKFRKKFLMYD